MKVTPANVHDSQMLVDPVDQDNQNPVVRADSAYRSEETEGVLQEPGYESHICEKLQAGQPLRAEREAKNRERSKIRFRVEHVFVFQQNSMGGKLIRTVGLALAGVMIVLMNMTYNLTRYLQITKHRERAPDAALGGGYAAEKIAPHSKLQEIRRFFACIRHCKVRSLAVTDALRGETEFFEVSLNSAGQRPALAGVWSAWITTTS